MSALFSFGYSQSTDLQVSFCSKISNLSSASLAFLLLVLNSLGCGLDSSPIVVIKQLQEGVIFSGGEFEGTVLHGRTLWWQECGAAGLIVTSVRKQRVMSDSPQLALFFLSIWNPRVVSPIAWGCCPISFNLI